jgi:hypothetical protein
MIGRSAILFFLIPASLILTSCPMVPDSDQSYTISSDSFVFDGIDRYYGIGYTQMPGHQDSILFKTAGDPSGLDFTNSINGADVIAETGGTDWSLAHDTSTDDGVGKFIGIDESGRIYALFTVTGSTTNIHNSIIQGGAFDNAPFPFYGMPAGTSSVVKNTVVAQIDSVSGEIIHGSFLTARRRSDGKTNAMSPVGIGFRADGTVVVRVSSSFYPPAAGATRNSWIEYAPEMTVSQTQYDIFLPADLSELSDVRQVK